MLTLFSLASGFIVGWVVRSKITEIKEAWRTRFGFGPPDA